MAVENARAMEQDGEQCKCRSEGRLPHHQMARRILSLRIEEWQILGWELSSSPGDVPEVIVSKPM